MKKITIGIVTIVLLFGVVTFADEIARVFNFSSLLDKAVENSISIDSSKLTLESKELDLVDILKDAETYNYPGGDRLDYINRMIIVQSDPLIAQMNVELASMALAKEEVKIKSDIYIKGMNYLLTQDEIALNEKIFEFKSAYREFAEKKVEVGVSIGSDLTNKVIDLQSQELKLLELSASLEAIKIEMNHLLGESLGSGFAIEDSIEPITFVNYNIDAIFARRVEKYPDVYIKTETLKSKQIIFNLYDEKYVEADKEYKVALYNRKMAEIELEDAQKSFEVSLRSAHNKYLSAHDSYLLTVRQNELSTKLYDNSKLKYDLGVINKEELLKSEEAKINSDFSIIKAIYDYNVAKKDFDNLY